MTTTKPTKSVKTAKAATSPKRGAGNLLAVKRQLRRTRPVFKRHGAHRKAELSDRWKKPRGLHNKLKDNKRGCGPVVSDGYRTPEAVRGHHVSGLAIVHVATVDALAGLDAATQGIVIARVGGKRQLEIMAAATKAGIRVLNHDVEKRTAELTARFTAGKQERERAREAKKAAEAKKAKAAKKADTPAAESDEDHKAAEEKAKKEVLTGKDQ
jgi:large subunit ribosomal protein L32e